MTKSLADRWFQLATEFDIGDDVMNRHWEIIQMKYSESHRYYHTLKHIENMFKHFDTVEEDLQIPGLVAMAIFFHDIIYDPKEKDNEEKSIELFKKFAKESATLKESEHAERITNWVLDTKNHLTDVHSSSGTYGHSDLYFFLDMDMSILGSPTNVYQEYANNIRKEYSHYSDEDFNRGRAKVLRDFLKVPNIFATKYFRDRFEVQARRNTRKEIEYLEENAD